MLLKNREPFASFLNTVNRGQNGREETCLITDQPFYREWIMEETNRKALHNLISYYTDAPVDLNWRWRFGRRRKTERTGLGSGQW